MDGFIPTLRVESDATTLNVVTPPVRPLGRVDGNPESVLLGLYVLGRSLARLHTSSRLSHNNVCESSIFVNDRTGAWLLSDELASDMKGNFVDLLHRISSMLDTTNLPPEFQGSTMHTITASYPVHARDAFSYAKLVRDLTTRLSLPLTGASRTILESMYERDYSKRPTVESFVKSDFFANNESIRIVSQLIDLRHGALSNDAAIQLFTELPSIINSYLGNKVLLGLVIDNLTKFSVVVHPAATSTKFIQSFFSAKVESSNTTSSNTGILPLEDYLKLVLPFIGELWSMERPGLMATLLRTIGKYVNRMNPEFVSQVVVKRIVSLNILLEPGIPQLYLQALPILLKALLKKSQDVAPIIRHLVQQVPLFNGNDIALRTKALTCLLVHPKIPNLLIKEYLAKGLTDSSSQIRLNVLTAAKKFGLQYADNSGPMSAKCLADAVMGSLLLSMVDSDAKVRDKARKAIRKLTYVMERKDAEIEASFAAQHRSQQNSLQPAVTVHTPKEMKTTTINRSSTATPTSPMNNTTQSALSMADDWDDDDFSDASNNSTSQSTASSTPLHLHVKHASTPSDTSNISQKSPSTPLNSASAQQTKDISDDDIFSAKPPAAVPSTSVSSKAQGNWGASSWDAWDGAEEDETDGLVGASDTPLTRSKASFSASWEEAADYTAPSPRDSAKIAATSIAAAASTGQLSKPSSSVHLSPASSASKLSTKPLSYEEPEEIKVTTTKSITPPVVSPSKSFEMRDENEEEALDAWGADDDFNEDFDEPILSNSSVPVSSSGASSFAVSTSESSLSENIKPPVDLISGQTLPVANIEPETPIESLLPSTELDAPATEQNGEPKRESPDYSSHLLPTDSLEANEEDMGDWGDDF